MARVVPEGAPANPVDLGEVHQRAPRSTATPHLRSCETLGHANVQHRAGGMMSQLVPRQRLDGHSAHNTTHDTSTGHVLDGSGDLGLVTEGRCAYNPSSDVGRTTGMAFTSINGHQNPANGSGSGVGQSGNAFNGYNTVQNAHGTVPRNDDQPNAKQQKGIDWFWPRCRDGVGEEDSSGMNQYNAERLTKRHRKGAVATPLPSGQQLNGYSASASGDQNTGRLTQAHTTLERSEAMLMHHWNGDKYRQAAANPGSAGDKDRDTINEEWQQILNNNPGDFMPQDTWEQILNNNPGDCMSPDAWQHFLSPMLPSL